jgi:hypothetical protein
MELIEFLEKKSVYLTLINNQSIELSTWQDNFMSNRSTRHELFVVFVLPDENNHPLV